MKAFLFPGQGAQYVGMGRSLYESFPAARAVFDRANELLGFDLARTCFEGPEAELTRTDVSQPAILTCSVAALAAMGNAPCDAAAGLSLGEYTALVCAGAIDFDQAVPLVHDRGKFMQEACEAQSGTMASIIGLDRQKVNEAVSRASDAGTVAAANFNCPGQIVISGEIPAVEKACAAAKQLGEFVGKRALSEHDLHRSVAQHNRDACGGVDRVQGQVGAAGLEDAQDADDDIDAALHAKPDHRVGVHPQRT